MKNDKRKQTLYFPDEMLRDIAAEARRLDRSLSWVLQTAWGIARNVLRDRSRECDVERIRRAVEEKREVGT
jgi:uncharacterized small protein (TIGR04563 family)